MLCRDTSCGRNSSRVAWRVYLACFRLYALRAYCNFKSKQAISITLFGRRSNNNFSPQSSEYATDSCEKLEPTFILSCQYLLPRSIVQRALLSVRSYAVALSVAMDNRKTG